MESAGRPCFESGFERGRRIHCRLHPDIQGDLYLEAHLKGPVSRLHGKGSVKGDHLDVMGQSVERMTLDIELKDNRLHVQPLQVIFETESVVNGSGWIGFDGGIPWIFIQRSAARQH